MVSNPASEETELFRTTFPSYFNEHVQQLRRRATAAAGILCMFFLCVSLVSPKAGIVDIPEDTPVVILKEQSTVDMDPVKAIKGFLYHTYSAQCHDKEMLNARLWRDYITDDFEWKIALDGLMIANRSSIASVTASTAIDFVFLPAVSSSIGDRGVLTMMGAMAVELKNGTVRVVVVPVTLEAKVNRHGRISQLSEFFPVKFMKHIEKEDAENKYPEVAVVAPDTKLEKIGKEWLDDFFDNACGQMGKAMTKDFVYTDPFMSLSGEKFIAMCRDETDLAGAFTPLSSVTSGSMVSFSGYAGIGVRDPHTKQPCANIFQYQIVRPFEKRHSDNTFLEKYGTHFFSFVSWNN